MEKSLNIWFLAVGEPLPIDSVNVRLRRTGILAELISSNPSNNVEWFATSFEHFTKKQRCLSSQRLLIENNFYLNLAYLKGYKKNISLERIIFNKKSAKLIKDAMDNNSNVPDIIFVLTVPLEVCEMAVLWGKTRNIPVIVDIRDLWPEIYYDVVPQNLKYLLFPYVEYSKIKLRKALQNASAIFATSKGFLNYGLKYAKRDKMISDGVYPIAHPNYEESNLGEKQAFLKELGICKDDFVVLCTGNFGKQFNYTPIVNVAKRMTSHKRIKFVLCGLGPKREQIKKNISENIILPGWINQKQITALLEISTIGIAPYIDSINYRLNTPNKFSEYLFAGLIIAVSVHGEMEEELLNNNCGFYYHDEDFLYAKLMEYYNSDFLVKESKLNSRVLYSQKYNANIIYQSMIKNIKIIAENKKGVLS